ncbi:hypothetical protein BJ508DRAFT_415987 [Ascobolus immersus RN42]|uniref:Uncharacterized protein n=1 Tax=Ascobolus immersus RN42 TaxID=1160509 RepID=A0A3N4HZR1_ASCIM|nr:hypothetical protein BJ508DRAFT_415987 [Ascobolus immersus RN42]
MGDSQEGNQHVPRNPYNIQSNFQGKVYTAAEIDFLGDNELELTADDPEEWEAEYLASVAGLKWGPALCDPAYTQRWNKPSLLLQPVPDSSTSTSQAALANTSAPESDVESEKPYKAVMLEVLKRVDLAKAISDPQYTHLAINAYEEACRSLESLEKDDTLLNKGQKQRILIMAEEYWQAAKTLHLNSLTDKTSRQSKRHQLDPYATLRTAFRNSLKGAALLRVTPLPLNTATVTDTLYHIFGTGTAMKDCAKAYYLTLLIAPFSSTKLRDATPVPVVLDSRASPVLIAQQLGRMGYKAAFVLRRYRPQDSKPHPSIQVGEKKVKLSPDALRKYRYLITVDFPEEYVKSAVKSRPVGKSFLYQDTITYDFQPSEELPVEIEVPPSATLPLDILQGMIRLGMEPRFSASLRKTGAHVRMEASDGGESGQAHIVSEGQGRLDEIDGKIAELQFKCKGIKSKKRKRSPKREALTTIDVFVKEEGLHCKACAKCIRNWAVGAAKWM